MSVGIETICFVSFLVFCCFELTQILSPVLIVLLHGWEIAVILRNFRKTKLSKSKFLFFLFFFLKLYFNIHTMCNSMTFALRHMQISLSGILRHFRPPSRHLLLNTHDTNMEFLQLSGPLLDIFLFFSKTKIFHSHPCYCEFVFLLCNTPSEFMLCVFMVLCCTQKFE